jgi:hypothetical protein
MIAGFRFALELDSVRKLLNLNFTVEKCLKCELQSQWLMFQHLDKDNLPFNDDGVEPIGLCLDHFEALYYDQYEKYKSTITVN